MKTARLAVRLRSIHYFTWAEFRAEFKGGEVLDLIVTRGGGGWVEGGRVELRTYSNGDQTLIVPVKKRDGRGRWVRREEVIEVPA